jgi:hypothetical protein
LSIVGATRYFWRAVAGGATALKGFGCSHEKKRELDARSGW